MGVGSFNPNIPKPNDSNYTIHPIKSKFEGHAQAHWKVETKITMLRFQRNPTQTWYSIFGFHRSILYVAKTCTIFEKNNVGGLSNFGVI